MISAELKQQIEKVKSSSKVPSVFLISGLYQQEKKLEKLKFIAEILEEGLVSEPKGNLLSLDTDSTSIKVDEVRELLKNLSLRNWDVESKRYVLVPQAELLTLQSSNALLKSLEEAPAGTCFILGVPSRRAVLKTVLSRSFCLKDEEGDGLSTIGLDEPPSEVDVNVFYEAFFRKNYDVLTKISKADLRYEWQSFSVQIKDEFVEKVYSGRLNKEEWFRLFNFMDKLEEQMIANMDLKWLVAAIKRFAFQG